MRTIFVLAAGTLVCAATFAQEKTAAPKPELSANDVKQINAAVRKPTPVKMWVVYQDFTSSFDALPQRFNEFSEEVRRQKLDAQMSGRPTSMMIVREDPTGKRELRLSVALQVAKKLDVKEPLKVEEFQERHAIRVTRSGSFQTLGAVHAQVREQLTKLQPSSSKAPTPSAPILRETTFPVVVRLLNDPRKIPPAQIRTEMIVPAR